MLHSLPWNNTSVTYQVAYALEFQLRAQHKNGDHINDGKICVWLREGDLYYGGLKNPMLRRRMPSIDPIAPRQLVMDLQSDEDWVCGHLEDARGVWPFVCLIKESKKYG